MKCRSESPTRCLLPMPRPLFPASEGKKSKEFFIKTKFPCGGGGGGVLGMLLFLKGRGKRGGSGDVPFREPRTLSAADAATSFPRVVGEKNQKKFS